MSGEHPKAVQPTLARLDAASPIKGGVVNSDIVRSNLACSCKARATLTPSRTFSRRHHLQASAEHWPAALQPHAAPARRCQRGRAVRRRYFDDPDIAWHVRRVPRLNLRLMGQRGLLGADAPVRHSAKRRRFKTVMQKLIYRVGRLIEHGRRSTRSMALSTTTAPAGPRCSARRSSSAWSRLVHHHDG